MDPVARCEKCGREFLSMPMDGLDHYDWRSGYRGNSLKPRHAEFEECLGTVTPIAIPQSAAVEKE